MTKKASKTSAIEFLCNKLNIEKEEVIAIGDNYNDMDMLQYAGVGIAMGNAPDIVKKKADDITSTNDEDGVAKALEKYFLYN
ncbi:putative phosphatase [compost metagenome]